VCRVGRIEVKDLQAFATSLDRQDHVVLVCARLCPPLNVPPDAHRHRYKFTMVLTYAATNSLYFPLQTGLQEMVADSATRPA
jgi:hypothetical protein